MSTPIVAYDLVKRFRRFTPRNLRRGQIDRSGPGAQEKSKAMRKNKVYSDLFIHQSESVLEKQPHTYGEYKKWSDLQNKQGKMQ